MQIKPETTYFSATVAFSRVVDGKTQEPFDWAMGEGQTASEVIESARRKLLTVSNWKDAMESTATIVKINQQWDADGKLI